MDVLVAREGIDKRRVSRQMGEHAKFDLRIVSREQAESRRGHEGAPDTASLFAARRDVLQIRFRRAQPAGRRKRLMERRMEAA